MFIQLNCHPSTVLNPSSLSPKRGDLPAATIHHLPLAKSRQQQWEFLWFCGFVFHFPKTSHPMFVQSNFCPSTVLPSLPQPTMETIADHHCLPIATCKEKAETVSLCVCVFFWFLIIRKISHHLFFNFNCCPSTMLLFLLQSTKGTFPVTTVLHLPLTKGKHQRWVCLFFLLDFYHSKDFSPPVF